jgi:DNA-binding transcriptional regulator YiaG
MNNLLLQLQQSQKKIKKNLKQNLHINNSFGTLTDEEIAMVLALRAKNIRKQQKLKQKDFANQINLSSPTTYSNFEQKGTISLLNFIKVIRGFGKLNELEQVLIPSIEDTIKYKFSTI